MSATERRRSDVLRAIIADFAIAHQPVGSKALLERHGLGVSSATIRNDMAVLEAEGYITQQHTSSGRIPTEKGYRRFVDTIAEIKPLSSAERSGILRFLDGAIDPEDVLRRSAQLLSQLTHHVAVVQVPTLTAARMKHIELVSLTPTRLLVVVITDSGRVEQRSVECAQPLDPAVTARLRDLLNRLTAEKTLPEAAGALAAAPQGAPTDLQDPLARIVAVLVDLLADERADKLILSGAANLAKAHPEFVPSLHGVLEALEEQVVVLRLLSTARELQQVHVSIGGENPVDELKSTSLISAAYGSDGEILGAVGVLGPTHMDYPGTIAHVAAVARYIGRILGGDPRSPG